MLNSPPWKATDTARPVKMKLVAYYSGADRFGRAEGADHQQFERMQRIDADDADDDADGDEGERDVDQRQHDDLGPGWQGRRALTLRLRSGQVQPSPLSDLQCTQACSADVTVRPRLSNLAFSDS